jgi:origin recognition complex subunit 4
LLIAAEHTRVAGHDSFSFEMLYDTFRIQVRTSSAAPVQLGGVGIGMLGVGRAVMMGVSDYFENLQEGLAKVILTQAFEHLIQNRIFSLSATPAVGLAKEFMKYHSNVGREDVKAVVERQGPTSLKKWLSKAQ